MPRMVSLCTGIGGLDMAAAEVYGGELVAYADNDAASAAVFSRHHPGLPNIGDITVADFLAYEDIDIITGGFPCQGISNAGLRKGLADARSGIYIHVMRAVRDLRPRLVVLENVSSILRRGGPTVVGYLASLGYDAQWITVRASDAVGACHPRNRWFCAARLRDAPRLERRRSGAQPDASRDADTYPAPQDAHCEPGVERGGPASAEAQGRGSRSDIGRRGLLPTPLASDGDHGGPDARHSDGSWKPPAIGHLIPDPETWGEYAPAIERWTRVIGREAPNPHDTGPRGGRRVAAPFVEWMMGYDRGWVTETPGLDYRAQMARLGNAVMPQHAVVALDMMESLQWTESS